jgi:hypothetical protein
MCLGSTPSTPEVKPAAVAPSIVSPIEADSSAASAGEQERKRARAASGRSDTVLTGAMGDTSEVKTCSKQLLGQ